MALFGSNKKNTKAAPKAPKAEAKSPALTSMSSVRDLTQTLKHARVTEKATMHSAQGVYVFDIGETATKRDIMQAIKAMYGVTPRKVAVVPVPSKNVRSARTGKKGVKKGGKKAYVYLKSGETITIA